MTGRAGRQAKEESTMIDFSTDFGKHARERLEQEPIAWLVTVGKDGTPQPSPIWYLWDGETILIYSRPNTPKVRNVQRHPQTALHLEGNGKGGDIVILVGEASIDDTPPAAQNPAYLAKYADGIARIGMTNESFAAAYSTPIRFRPTQLRGF
jgi:PPOX class probable F420-dependent enzyme